MEKFSITEPELSEWPTIVKLISDGIPNTIIVKLGVNFARLYYKRFSSIEDSCVYVGRDCEGEVQGVIIGTINYPKCHSVATKGQLLSLLAAANIRLMSWSFLSWFLKGVISKLRGNREVRERPLACLEVISVSEGFRGTGLSHGLIKRLENFMRDKDFRGNYFILTEKGNISSNKFYKKIGSYLVYTSVHHGREINEWYKRVE